MPLEFDAVIFDCDGVLVDSEAIGLSSSAAYLRAQGLSYDEADLVRLFTGLRDDVFERLLVEAYVEAHGAPPHEGFFRGLMDARRTQAHALQAVAGAEAAARAIPGLKAVASSSRRQYLHSKLRRTGLYDLFGPHVYSAESVAHGKPAPDIFLFAAEQLRVAPARCLVVEDSAHGVVAGKAAGMTVWGFVGGGHCFAGHDARLIAAGADCVVGDFAEFVAALA